MNEIAYNEQFSTKETANILQHYNFTDWERNSGRDDLFVIPRASGRGRAGAEYGYAHLIERAIHVTMSAAFDRATITQFGLGLFESLKRKVANTPAYQSVLEKLQFADLGFEPEEDRRGFSTFVHSPEVIFNDDLISRDREHPTMALFLPSMIKNDFHKVRIIGADALSMSLAELREMAIEMATADTADERSRYSYAEYAATPALVDLTEILCRIDDNIARTLSARPGYMKTARQSD